MSRGIDVRKAEAALKRASRRALQGSPEERSGRLVSASVKEVKYDQQTRRLRVRFANGAQYAYLDVSPQAYEDLLKAPSKGRFFSVHIKPQHAFELIEPARRT